MEGILYALLIDGAVAATITCPRTVRSPSAEVSAIHPTAATLPVNQLRVYVYFTAAMSEGDAARTVSMRNAATGEPLAGTFLAMEPELWDHGRRRLTLLLEPGRIKRGLAPNTEAGYPLQQGQTVELVVDAAFRDAHGRPLRTPARRRYDIGPAQRTRVDPAHWRWRSPAAGSIEPLLVQFDRPLDHALAERCIEVRGPDGEPVIGRSSVAHGEGGWRFEPHAPWPADEHALRVDGRLEDLAGNSLHRVFDRDIERAEEATVDVEYVELRFAPGSAT